jgi:hypothetical protein
VSVDDCMPLIMNGLRRANRGARRAIYILAACRPSIGFARRRQLGCRSAGILPAIFRNVATRKTAGSSRIRVNKMPAPRMQPCCSTVLVVRLAGLRWERR